MNIGRLTFFIFFIAYCFILPPNIELQAQTASGDIEIVFSKVDVSEFISNNPVYSILKDKYGYMWIGGRGGLYKYDSIDCKAITDFNNNVIWSVYEDSRQVLWIGTEAGLFELDNNTGDFTRYTHDTNNPDSISSSIVWDIYEDSYGIFWIGTENGLNSLNRETGVFTRYIDDNNTNFNNNIVRSIYEDSHNIDLPPENDTRYNIVKGGINGQKRVHPGTNH